MKHCYPTSPPAQDEAASDHVPQQNEEHIAKPCTWEDFSHLQRFGLDQGTGIRGEIYHEVILDKSYQFIPQFQHLSNLGSMFGLQDLPHVSADSRPPRTAKWTLVLFLSMPPLAPSQSLSVSPPNIAAPRAQSPVLFPPSLIPSETSSQWLTIAYSPLKPLLNSRLGTQQPIQYLHLAVTDISTFYVPDGAPSSSLPHPTNILPL